MYEAAIIIIVARKINQCPRSKFPPRRGLLGNNVDGGEERGETFCGSCVFLVKFNNVLSSICFILVASGGETSMLAAIIFKPKIMNVIFGDRLFIIASQFKVT